MIFPPLIIIPLLLDIHLLLPLEVRDSCEHSITSLVLKLRASSLAWHLAGYRVTKQSSETLLTSTTQSVCLLTGVFVSGLSSKNNGQSLKL